VNGETVTVWSGSNTVPAAELVEQFNARYDESEKLDKEAYKQRVKTSEAEEKLAKAVEELDRTRIEKAEKSAAADVRISEAADIVTSLQEQAQQRCHQAVIENDTGELFL
jgi:hypothetical protein